MSQLYVDNIKGRLGGGVGAPSGIVVTGVGTFSGSVSIGGTLTYEDVTNIDSVGMVTTVLVSKFLLGVSMLLVSGTIYYSVVMDQSLWCR